MIRVSTTRRDEHSPQGHQIPAYAGRNFGGACHLVEDHVGHARFHFRASVLVPRDHGRARPELSHQACRYLISKAGVLIYKTAGERPPSYRVHQCRRQSEVQGVTARSIK